MASSVGLSHDTGLLLSDWDHVEQSISVILTTRIGQRVLRRDFGSEVPDLVGKPMTERVLLAFYVAAAGAIARWEPRFEVTKCEIPQAGADGIIEMQIHGIYYPRGHLGDFSTAANKSTKVQLNKNLVSNVAA